VFDERYVEAKNRGTSVKNRSVILRGLRGSIGGEEHDNQIMRMIWGARRSSRPRRARPVHELVHPG
jgi:hypothetical protein